MRVLVTGGSGFLGRQVVGILRDREHEVHAVARTSCGQIRGVQWHQANLLEQGASARVLANVRPDALMHLAWIATPPQFWTSPENLDWLAASVRMVRVFAELGGRRVVVAGTCAEYGNGRAQPYCEEDPAKPSTLYAASKNALREVLHQYSALMDIEYAWGRIFFLYGVREPAAKLLSSLIKHIAAGQVPEMREPDRLLDFVTVRDTALALATLVDEPYRGIVNVASGVGLSVRDAAKIIAAETSPRLVEAIDSLPRKTSDNHMLADIGRLRKVLDARTPFRDEIVRMIDASVA